ncbi:MAG: hypothetical protein AABX49_01570 [Nanoarchaeota archaeon]
MNKDLSNKEVIECIGLWLAEGDKKTKGEITFTNNCFDLIQYFHKTILKLFKDYNFNVRIYVYSPNNCKINVPLQDCKIKKYIDNRATKSYFIWRLASVDLVKKWKHLVEILQNDKESYEEILRGFFAGEGNIKTGSHNNRTLRIAQGRPLELIERILNELNINYKYKINERSYVITGKVNWDTCAKIKIADLHPIKKIRFWDVYKEFKEEHYPKNHLENNLFKILTKPYTAVELSFLFKRSQARISEILMSLKKLESIENYRIKSKDYWIRKDQNKILISDVKDKYLKMLRREEINTKDISKRFNVCWKSSFGRLKELEGLGLVTIDKNKNWSIKETWKEVIVI